MNDIIQYRFKEVIGSGAYSIVYLARNKINNNQVAIKIIDTSKLSKKEKTNYKNLTK